MRKLQRPVAAVFTLGMLALGTAFVPGAGATTHQVSCGAQITQSTTLNSDVGPCPSGPGLVIASSNVVLDLNGFRITGLNSAAEESVGVVLRQVSGVTVKNGVISGFDAGVVIRGGSGNIVEKLTLLDNIGNHPDCNFGDGLASFNSHNNIIRNNTVARNGPLSGISIVGASTGNAVRDNEVRDNSLVNVYCGNPRQDVGIRIEGPGASANTVSGNVVERNGLAGIALHSTLKGDPENRDNTVSDNRAAGNGIGGHGSGVIILPNGSLTGVNRAAATLIKGNTVTGNARDGIQVARGSAGNSLLKNSGSGNVRYDASDFNDGCAYNSVSNSWVHSNTFVTVNQPCVLGNPNAGPKKEEPEPEVSVKSHTLPPLL